MPERVSSLPTVTTRVPSPRDTATPMRLGCAVGCRRGIPLVPVRRVRRCPPRRYRRKEGEAVLEGHDVTGFGTAESHVGEYRRCRVVMAVVSVLAGPGAHVENAEPVGLADEDIAAIVGAVESGEPLDGKIPDLLRLGVVDQHTAVVAQCESRCGTALFDRRSRRRTLLVAEVSPPPSEAHATSVAVTAVSAATENVSFVRCMSTPYS